MTLTLKFLSVIFFTAILHGYTFSQGKDSALELYRNGIALKQKNPAQAFQLFEKAKNLSIADQDWDLYIKTVNVLASLNLEDEDKKAKILNWLKEAVERSPDFKNSEQLALLHYNIAEIYNLAYEIELPIKHYQKAKTIWISLYGELHKNVAACFHGLGDVYKYNKFDFYEAEKCYETALQIRGKIQFQDTIVLYKNYYSLAATNRSQRDFEKALSYGSKTLELANALSPIDLEKSYGMVANIYRDMGETSDAKEFYLKALELNKTSKDLSNRAWYYLSLGIASKVDSSATQALSYFTKAYELYKRPDIQDKDLYVNVLINLVELYSILKRDERMYRTFDELFQELHPSHKVHSREVAQAWFVLGGHHFRRAHFDSALFYFQKSLIASSTDFASMNVLDDPTEEQIGYRYYVSEVLPMKASAMKAKFLATGNIAFFNSSLSSLMLAERLVSKQRNTLDIDAAKWQFLEERYDLYENILAELFEAASRFPSDSIYDLAFQYFEKSKSRSLADALAEIGQTRQIAVGDSLLGMHSELKRKLFQAQDALIDELDNPANPEKMSVLRAEIVDLDQRVRSSKLAIEQKYPGYFNVKYGYETVPLRVIQDYLDSEGKVLLEYFWGNNAVYGFGSNGRQIIFTRIGSADSIKTVINNLLTHLSDKHATTNVTTFSSFVYNANKMYRILVDPFKNIIADKTRVHIIPDGSINQLPFEIFIEDAPVSKQVDYKSLRYLIKKFTIGYAYSSFMLVQKKTVDRLRSPSLLAIGSTGAESLRAKDSPLELIMGVEEELKSLEARFDAGKFLRSDDATESNFKTLAPDYDLLHLAIHGTGDTERNFGASLYFGKKDKQDDGELHAYELYGLKLKALMAVLSSCESGLGKGYKGEGMISMASAFIYSGCENILMSLWKVNDQMSIKLIDGFYQQILNGTSIDEALRQSKLDYIQEADELTADPKVWSPVIAYGSLNPIFEKSNNWTPIYIGVFLLIAIVFLLKFYLRASTRGDD